MKKSLSLVGRDYHTDENVVGYYHAGDRMKATGKTGDFWGWIWSLLFGSAFFNIPKVGPLLVAGPLINWILGGLEGAVVVGSLSALGVGLFNMGISEDSILRYEADIKDGKFIVIANGSVEETARAHDVLQRIGPDALAEHPAPSVASKERENLIAI